MKWLLLFTFLGSAVQAAEVLRVRPYLVVSPGHEVKLAELVDKEGVSTELMLKLQDVSISTAPAYGEKQELANASLTAALRPFVQEERSRSKKNLMLIIPKTVTIDTVKRALNPAMVQDELLQAWKPLCSSCKLEIEGLSLPRVEGVRDWTLKIKAELPRGSFSIPVDLIREDNSTTPAWISGRLITKKRVPVAKHLLNINDPVLPKDIAWEYRDTSFAIDGTPTAEDMVGMRMKQSLRNDEILWKNMLEREKVIRRGELVQVKSGQRGWEITMSVIAQQDAFMGDVVSLKNPKTGNVLMGTVVAQGEVELR